MKLMHQGYRTWLAGCNHCSGGADTRKKIRSVVFVVLGRPHLEGGVVLYWQGNNCPGKVREHEKVLGQPKEEVCVFS